MKKAIPYSKELLVDRSEQRSFQGDQLTQISMPLGGIGTGTICMNGHGGLQDYSIRHHPEVSALPDFQRLADAAFALINILSKNVCRLVEGPMPKGKIYIQGIKSYGARDGGFEGLPRFKNCTFKGEFPFGYAYLTDPDVPLSVKVTGYNPFIPLNDKDSSIPCAIMEYMLTNTSDERVDYMFSYNLSHLTPGTPGADGDSKGLTRPIPGKGIFYYNPEDPAAESYGSAALGVIGETAKVQASWFRGGWFDPISVLWREFSEGVFRETDGYREKIETQADSVPTRSQQGGSIMLQGSLQPGESKTYPIVITWYLPNVYYGWGNIEKECCSPFDQAFRTEKCKQQTDPCWRPYYASQWTDAEDVFNYIEENFSYLRGMTQAFHDHLFNSSLPSYVLDAVSANLGILKSPTVLRQENGNIWAWEGCFAKVGCCAGSCTHVWNYAMAMPFLFPALERTLREQELMRSMNDEGHVQFRSALPDGPRSHDFHAASDGQLGGVMKVYREWQVSGDRDWALSMYPLVKKSIDYCIKTWDPKRKGVLEEPHHNTYDIEFWGPDGMCSSFYIAGLAAMAQLANDLGMSEDAAEYQELAERGAAYLDEHLFNGEYYYQKVEYEGLVDQSFVKLVEGVDENSPYELQLLKKEGPKYQYGTGCISDGVLGAYMAHFCFVNTPQTAENIRKNLQSIFAYNFKESLADHSNPQRPGYALGDEPGLLLCTWPKGGKPVLPFVYSDEVWTGIEYQVAAHCISMGLVDEGLTIVRAARSRYDGKTRNPWDEYECGSYYARAMASYAVMLALSGFRYSAVEKHLWLEPKMMDGEDFRTFFTTASGWGTLVLKKDSLEIDLVEGTLDLEKLTVPDGQQAKTISASRLIKSGEKVRIEF